MLILSRKKDETMTVGHEVRVQVLGVAGNQVKIGIDAPREISIMRDELLAPPRDDDASPASSGDDAKAGG